MELLIIFEEDFDRVLRSTMEKQWFEKKTALMGLGYFKFFTREQVRIIDNPVNHFINDINVVIGR